MLNEQEKYDEFVIALKLEQNFNSALYYSIIAWITWSLFWLFMVANTWYYLKIMPLIIWFGIGYIIKLTWKGIERKFSILWWLVAIFSIFLWDLLLLIHFSALYENITMITLISDLDYWLLFNAYIQNFTWINLIYYWLWGAIAYYTSLRHIDYKSKIITENIES